MKRIGQDQTALIFLAVKFNHVELFQKLVAMDGSSVNQLMENNVSPLYLASCLGNVKMVELLIEAKADLRQRNPHGESPLLIAARMGNEEVVRSLAEFDPSLLEAETNEGATVIFIASYMGNVETLKYLLSKIPEFIPASLLEKVRTIDGMSPIGAAKLMGHAEIVQLLTDKIIALGMRAQTAVASKPRTSL